MVAFDPAGNVAVLYRKFAKMEETGRRLRVSRIPKNIVIFSLTPTVKALTVQLQQHP